MLGLFKRKVPQTKEDKLIKKNYPKPGEEWNTNPINDPWGGKKYPPVKILEVKGGWVRYSENETFSDERMEIDRFTAIYHITSTCKDKNNENRS